MSQTPSVVYVRWRDSMLGQNGWVEADEARRDAAEAFAAPLSAAGFLVADEPTHVVIATGYNPHTDEVQGALMVPRSEVVSLDELRPRETEPDDLCPNCVTPWKCNGPHLTSSEKVRPQGEEPR